MIDQPRLSPTPLLTDARGVFSKPFCQGSVEGEAFVIKELFWTKSSRGCIRGLHFQVPPFQVGKLVWVSRGAVIDVVVDVRNYSGFGSTTSYELGEESGTALWIPAGFAHGFQTLEDDTIVNYAVDAVYSPTHDTGIRWDSIDFNWPLPVGPMSDRDQRFPPLSEFTSPFEVTS